MTTNNCTLKINHEELKSFLGKDSFENINDLKSSLNQEIRAKSILPYFNENKQDLDFYTIEESETGEYQITIDDETILIYSFSAADVSMYLMSNEADSAKLSKVISSRSISGFNSLLYFIKQYFVAKGILQDKIDGINVYLDNVNAAEEEEGLFEENVFYLFPNEIIRFETEGTVQYQHPKEEEIGLTRQEFNKNFNRNTLLLDDNPIDALYIKIEIDSNDNAQSASNIPADKFNAVMVPYIKVGKDFKRLYISKTQFGEDSLSVTTDINDARTFGANNKPGLVFTIPNFQNRSFEKVKEEVKIQSNNMKDRIQKDPSLSFGPFKADPFIMHRVNLNPVRKNLIEFENQVKGSDSNLKIEVSGSVNTRKGGIIYTVNGVEIPVFELPLNSIYVDGLLQLIEYAETASEEDLERILTYINSLYNYPGSDIKANILDNKLIISSKIRVEDGTITPTENREYEPVVDLDQLREIIGVAKIKIKKEQVEGNEFINLTVSNAALQETKIGGSIWVKLHLYTSVTPFQKIGSDTMYYEPTYSFTIDVIPPDPPTLPPVSETALIYKDGDLKSFIAENWESLFENADADTKRLSGLIMALSENTDKLSGWSIEFIDGDYGIADLENRVIKIGKDGNIQLLITEEISHALTSDWLLSNQDSAEYKRLVEIAEKIRYEYGGDPTRTPIELLAKLGDPAIAEKLRSKNRTKSKTTLFDDIVQVLKDIFSKIFTGYQKGLYGEMATLYINIATRESMDFQAPSDTVIIADVEIDIPVSPTTTRRGTRRLGSTYQALIKDFVSQVESNPEYGKLFLDQTVQTLTGDLVSYISLVEATPDAEGKQVAQFSNVANLLNGNLDFNQTYQELLGQYYNELLELKESNKLKTPRAKYLLFVLNKKNVEYFKEVFKQKNTIFQIQQDKTIVKLDEEDTLKEDQKKDNASLADLDFSGQQDNKDQIQSVLEGSVSKEQFKKQPNTFNFDEADQKVRAFVKLLPQIERVESGERARIYSETDVDKLIEAGVPADRFFPFRSKDQVFYVRALETPLGAIRLNDTIKTWSNLTKLFAGQFSIDDMLAQGYNNLSKVLRDVPEFFAIEPLLNSRKIANLDHNQLVIKFESAFKRFENPLYVVLNNDGIYTVINESSDIFPLVKNLVNNTLRSKVISNESYKKHYDTTTDTLNVYELLKIYGYNLDLDIRGYEPKKLEILGLLGFNISKGLNSDTDVNAFFYSLLNFLKKADSTKIPVDIVDFIIKDQEVTKNNQTISIQGLNNYFKAVYKKQNEITPFSYTVMTPNAEGELQSAYSIPNSILQDAALLNALTYEKNPVTKESLKTLIPRSNNPTFKASLFFNFLFNEEGSRKSIPNVNKPYKIEIVNWNGLKNSEEGSASSGKLNVDLDNYSKLFFDFIGLLVEGYHENTRAQVSSTSYAIRLNSYSTSYKYPIVPSTIKNMLEQKTVPQDSLLFKQFVKYFNAAIEEAKAMAAERGTPNEVQVPVMFSKDFENLISPDKRSSFLTTPINLDNPTQTGEFADLLYKFFMNITSAYAADMSAAGGLEKIKKNGKLPRAIESLVSKEGLSPFGLYALYAINSYVIRTEEIILFQGSHERVGTSKAKYFKRANLVQSTRVPVTGSLLLRDNINKAVSNASFASKLNYAPFKLENQFRTSVLADIEEPSPDLTLTEMNFSFIESIKAFYNKIGKRITDEEAQEIADKTISKYNNVTVSDGQGIINPDAYLALRMGIGGDSSLVKAHHALSIDMIYNQDVYFSEQEIQELGLPSKDTLTPEELTIMREGIELIDKGKVVFPSLKWTHRGSTANKSGLANEVVDKFSLFPLYIQYVYNKPQLKKLALSMLKSNMAYVKFKSGTKFDTVVDPIEATSYQDIDSLADIFNNQSYTLLTNNLGEQITTPTYAKVTTIFGSQFRKLIVQALNLIRREDLSLAWDNSVIEMSSTLREEILKEFGVKNEDFSQIDLVKIAKVLRDHSLTKDLTENVVEFLEKMENGTYTYMEANLAQKDVQNLIASVVKKVAVQKIHGSQLIQVSSALDHLDDRLGWYGIGKPAECKVSMMGDFMNLLNLPEVRTLLQEVPIEDRNILAKTRILNRLLKDPEFVKKHRKVLTIVTYRIPTQGLNSMDVFTIKEFLPHFQAPQIVLPPEAVVKSGTDYDYDKAPAIFPRIDSLGRFQDKVQQNQIINVAALKAQYESNKKAIKEKYKNLARAEKQEIYEEYEVNLLKDDLSELRSNLVDYQEKLKKTEAEIDELKERLVGETKDIKEIIQDHINFLSVSAKEYRALIADTKKDINSLEKDIRDLKEELKEFVDPRLKRILESKRLELTEARKEYFNALDVFKSYSPQKLNQNKVLSAAIDILMLPENYFILITPNSTDLVFNPLDEFYNNFYPPNFRDEPSGSQLASHQANYKKFKVVKMSDLLGIAATTNTLYTLFQNYTEAISRTYTVTIGKQEFSRTIPTILTRQRNNNSLDTLIPFTEDGELKSEILAQNINVTVDAPGDDRFGYANFNLNNYGAALYLIYAHGTPFYKLLRFFHHPAVVKYEELLQKWDDPDMSVTEYLSSKLFTAEENNKFGGLPFMDKLYSLISELNYGTIERGFVDYNTLNSPTYSVDNFFDEMTSDDKAVLAYYLIVLDASEAVRKVNSVINFDRSPDNVMMKFVKRVKDLQEVSKLGIVSPEFLRTIFGNSMISGVYTNSILAGITNRLFPALYDPANVNIFIKLSEGVRGYNQDKFIVKVTNDFLLSIIQNFATIEIGERELSLYDIGVRNLMVKKAQLSTRASELNEQFISEKQDIRLLKIITNSIGKRKDVSNIRIFRGFEDSTEDRNRLISEFRFLLNHEDEKIRSFAINLAVTGLIQSGYSKSPLFFSDIIPEEFISPIIIQAVNKYQSLSRAQKRAYALAFKNAFAKVEPRLVGERSKDIESYRFKDLKLIIETVEDEFAMDSRSSLELLNNIFERSIGMEESGSIPTIEITGASLPITEETGIVEPAQVQSTAAELIYNQLGDKTQSENVVIDEVNGRKPTVESNNYYEGNIKPEPNTIFVFGSNPEGKHGAGAAKVAREQFGAIYGQGEGLQGSAYALPTKDLNKAKKLGLYSPAQIKTFMKNKVIPYYKSNPFTDVVNKNPFERSINPEQIINSIQKLYEQARTNPSKEFKIGYKEDLFGYSLNAYLHGEMIEMFNAAGEIPSNIIFSKEWVDTGKINWSKTPKTFATEVGQPTTDRFRYYGAFYDIKLQDGVAVDVENLKRGDSETNAKFQERKNKILAAYNANPNVDPQNNKPFRNATEVTQPVVVEPAPAVQKQKPSYTFKDGFRVELEFELNNEQKNALRELENFVKGNDKTITIAGAAGTGKTTIISIFNKWLDRNYLTPKYTSPTHRANSITKLMNTDVRVFTLHSLFGLSPEIDLTKKIDAKNLKFGQFNKPRVESRDLLIVDESSLVSDILFDFLKKSQNENTLKIIYVGDEAQLKPVGQTTRSKVFEEADHKVVYLRKVERTGDNAVLKESVNIRNGNDWTYQSELNSRGEGVQYVDSNQDFRRLANKLFKEQQEMADKLHVRILSATNKGVEEINSVIRKDLWGDAHTNQLVKGDLLMGYDNFDYDYYSGQFRLYNGGDYEVLSVTPSETNIEEINESFKGYEVTIKNALEPKARPYRLFVVDKDEDTDKARKFSNHIQELTKKAAAVRGTPQSARMFDQANRLKAKLAFMEDIIDYDPADGEPKVVIRKTFDYGYAHTIHKSQGGSYNNVMILADTIYAFPDESTRQEAKYVAVSRARKVAYIRTSKSIIQQDENEQQECAPM